MPSINTRRMDPRFWIIVLSDLSGDARAPLEPLSERRLVDLTPGNVNDQMTHFVAGLRFRVANTLFGSGTQMAIDLNIERPDDFNLRSVIRGIPALKGLHEEYSRCRWLADQLQDDTAASCIANILFDLRLLPSDQYCLGDEALVAGRRMLEKCQELLRFDRRVELEFALAALEEDNHLVWSLGSPAFAASSTVAKARERAVGMASAVDAKISEQSFEITRHPKFRHLEDAWMGLMALVRRVGSAPEVRISALSLSGRELRYMTETDRLSRLLWQRMRRAWGRSPLVDPDDEMDWPDLPIVGGQPLGLILCDLALRPDYQDREVLRQLSRLGQALHAPVLVNLDHEKFREEPMSDADRAWHSELRATEAACYLAMAAPEVVAPGHETAVSPIDLSSLQAEGKSVDHDVRWVSPVIALASQVTSDVMGLEKQGGQIISLPPIRDPGGRRSDDLSTRGPSDPRELGVNTVIQRPGCEAIPLTDPVVLHSSACRPSLRLMDLLLVSRLAQQLRLRARQLAMSEAADLQANLQSWLDEQVPGRFAFSFGDAMVLSASISVSRSNEAPTFRKGFLKYPRYFAGHLAASLQDQARGTRRVAIEVALFQLRS